MTVRVLRLRNYLKALRRDPLAAAHYLLGGKEALLRRGLNRLLGYEATRFREEFATDSALRLVFDEIAHLPYLGWIKCGEVIYVLVRALRPTVVVETGVAVGVSSACILAALERNGMGQLHSVDLPNYERTYLTALGIRPAAMLQEGKTSGFIVPESLRSRWHLHLGNSRDLLPQVLSKLKDVEVFLHDSEHTYEAMTFEFETVWPRLSSGGLLLSDDVIWNSAFPDFCRRHRLKPVYFWLPNLAVVKKP